MLFKVIEKGLVKTLFIFVVCALAALPLTESWDATWESLDSRPLPSWYDDAKLGIFLHWGVFSVPSFGSEWFWAWWQGADYRQFLNQTENMNRFSYQEYAARFDATLYQPKEWADVFAQSGARYVVLTSKHHEGYCMWNSTNVPTTWNWNVMDIGPKRDLLGDLAQAVKQTPVRYGNDDDGEEDRKLKFGVYHSLFEWYNPLYLQDKANHGNTQHFVELKILPELCDLVLKYEPELIWSDGDWEANSTYWKSTEFLAWYATDSPVAETAVWNDRWGNGTSCRHGAYWNCKDRFHPNSTMRHKWESAVTVDKTSWGWNRNATWDQYMNVTEIVHILIETVALGGNLLLNIGPGADGTLSPIFVDRLMGLGEWLRVNGEAIYGSRLWPIAQNETSSVPVFYTKKQNGDDDDGVVVYAVMTAWPTDNILSLQAPTPTDQTTARFVGLTEEGNLSSGLLSWKPKRFVVAEDNHRHQTTKTGIEVELPILTPNLIPCQHAWAIALTHLEQQPPPPRQLVRPQATSVMKLEPSDSF